MKYQKLVGRIKTLNTKTSTDAPEFDAFFELNIKDEQLQTHRDTIRKLKAQISMLKTNKNYVSWTLGPRYSDPKTIQMQETISKLNNENDCFRTEISKVNMH